jgi:hypothetical protein
VCTLCRPMRECGRDADRPGGCDVERKRKSLEVRQVWHRDVIRRARVPDAVILGREIVGLREGFRLEVT